MTNKLVMECATYLSEYHRYDRFTIVKDERLAGRYVDITDIPASFRNLPVIKTSTEDIRGDGGVRLHNLVIEC